MIAPADAQQTASDVELTEMIKALRAGDGDPTPAAAVAPQHGRDEVGYGHGV